MFSPLAHVSEGVDLLKIDQPFLLPLKPCVEGLSSQQFSTVAPQSLIMHIINEVYVYKQNCCERSCLLLLLEVDYQYSHEMIT